MTWWRKRERVDMEAVAAADKHVAELEDRAADVARKVRERDPWASRVLDTIHGEPHAR